MKAIQRFLQTLFSGFLASRHTRYQFRRAALLDALEQAQSGKTGEGIAAPLVSRKVTDTMMRIASENTAQALARMNAHPRGLTAAEAQARQARVGANEVAHEQPLHWSRHVWQCYKNPFNLLLSVLAAIAFATDDREATVVISTMVVLSTLIRFVQEGRSNRAAERLKAMVSNTASVLRRADGDESGHPRTVQELPIRELVPGDLVLLSAGDMIPADCRLITAKDLFVAQAAMTGESLPVEKWADAQASTKQDDGLFAASNLVFMGTNVVSGTATALVVATGARTVFGALSARVGSQARGVSAFQAGVNSVSWLLIRFALVMVPVVLLINGATKGDWPEAFLFALSVAVGLTPEMLPMIVTSTLAKGAVVLSRQKVIVKRLDAIQNFGAMDVLCTDKTGTLTQDHIVLERHTDAFGAASEETLHYAWLNSYYQTGLKNLLDRAVLEHADVQQSVRAHAWCKLDEIPFDFERRRMSVVVTKEAVADESARATLICKGAVEEVLAVCSQIRVDKRTVALDVRHEQTVRRVTQDLNQQGLRVVAVAIKEYSDGARSSWGRADECDLTLVGYIAFLDPPKDSAASALDALAASGVAVKVLTGDSERIAAHVCAQVGLLQGDSHDKPHPRILLGHELDAMDEAALAQAARTHQVFARLTPQHKERIVLALRQAGHVVGFLGDGINDAPALRAADIGISVDAAVDIAKEAADIILLEKSLMVLQDGVIEGRKTFSNMLKYIRMTASSNFGNVFSVLVASVFLPFLPMLPLHLLVQNLLYDISQIAIPFDRVDQDLVAKPLRWNPPDIGRFMLFFGPISSIFDIFTYWLMWTVFAANTVQAQTLFQSGWFVVGLLTQTLIVHMIRSPKLPFIESRAAWPLIIMTAIIMAIGIWLPMSTLAEHFKLQALPMDYFPWLAGILCAYALLTTLMKRFYIRRFGWQ